MRVLNISRLLRGWMVVTDPVVVPSPSPLPSLLLTVVEFAAPVLVETQADVADDDEEVVEDEDGATHDEDEELDVVHSCVDDCQASSAGQLSRWSLCP
jgi:hypothetical protein